jgi:hypothetical protein
MKVDFFIVGAPKSGTTSLYHYLDQHSDINMSIVKEPNYFSAEELKRQDLYYKSKIISTIDEYDKLFKNQKGNQLLGEASVSYLFYPDVAGKIKLYNPNAKIIILLRDPIERAYSHHNMDRRLGYVKDDLSNIINDSSVMNHSLYYQQYIQLGQYYTQVKNYIDVFGRDNVCVMLYDDLKENNKDLTDKVISFLKLKEYDGIDYNIPYNSSKSSDFKIINFLYKLSFLRRLVLMILPVSLVDHLENKFFKSKEIVMSQDLESQLYDLYCDEILLLEKMLNVDLSLWKR